MIKIKYKKISESSLNYFSKTIYSDIQKFYKNETLDTNKSIRNLSDNKNIERLNLDK